MLFLSITKPEFLKSLPSAPIGVELRLDLFPQIDFEFLEKFLKEEKRSILFTLRKASQGGHFRGTEKERQALIEKLLALSPPFFDLESDMDPGFLQKNMQKHSSTKFILSSHHFEKMPDLENLYRAMRRYDAFSYKIAVTVFSANEALKMLLFAKKHPKVSAICMGEKGAFARVLGKVAGNLVGYANLDASIETGPGQIPLFELETVYRYLSLSPDTAIYCLIGDPVDKSPGHLYHNAIFHKKQLDAVYVKMNVRSEELESWIELARELGIRGASVTTPLKEKILPFLDEIDPMAKQIGAVNTLLFQKGRIIGANTDGLGALDAIEKKSSVFGKKMVLLGAGGAARAIAFEAKARGALVVILNRTKARATRLAQELGCASGSLDEVPSEYDILVNCSPDPMPIDAKRICPNILAMDVVYFPKETEVLKAALCRGCQAVYGEEMFLNQALKQSIFWVGS